MDFLHPENMNIVSVVLSIAFFYPIIVGMLFKMKSRNMMETIKSVLTSIAFLISLMFTVLFVKNVIIDDKYGMISLLDEKLKISIDGLISNSKLATAGIYIVVLIIIYSILKGIIGILNRSVLMPLSRNMDMRLRESARGTRTLLGGIFQIPRAVCYVLAVSVLLTFASIFAPSDNLDKALSESAVYSFLESKVIQPVINSDMAKKLPNILENSFIIQEDDGLPLYTTDDGYIRGLVFYNGVTIDEGIRSSDEIDYRARQIAYSYDSSYDKAKALYKWVGTNIKYDNDKAVEVMSSDMPENISSGAITAYNTRSGVCFDYACLYAAMCRANNIGVRLIIGEGFNGASWVSHSWNEVYIPEENKWIKVDTTFYSAGNYFDNMTFDLEHRNRKIAGEWM